MVYSRDFFLPILLGYAWNRLSIIIFEMNIILILLSLIYYKLYARYLPLLLEQLLPFLRNILDSFCLLLLSTVL
jgi:hypothetical protein